MEDSKELLEILSNKDFQKKLNFYTRCEQTLKALNIADEKIKIDELIIRDLEEYKKIFYLRNGIIEEEIKEVKNPLIEKIETLRKEIIKQNNDFIKNEDLIAKNIIEYRALKLCRIKVKNEIKKVEKKEKEENDKKEKMLKEKIKKIDKSMNNLMNDKVIHKYLME